MQKANLSYSALQDCLQQLERLDLMKVHPDTLEYATTEKGVTFLVKWRQLQEFLTPEEKVSIRTQRNPPKF
jgi:predicted transcriptional regulator